MSEPVAKQPIDSLFDPERRREQAICFGLLMAVGVYRLVTLWTVPSLIGSDPVLLELLRGSTSSMIAGGAFARVGRASLTLAILAPIITLMMANPIVWWAGRLWGPSVVDLLVADTPRARRAVRRAVSLVERGRSWAVFLAPVLPLPTALIYAAAGWTGMRFVRFIVLDLLGTLLWIGLIVGLGYGIGHPAVHVAHQITRYGLWFTIGIVVVSVALAVWRTPRSLPPPEPGDGEGDAEPGPTAGPEPR